MLHTFPINSSSNSDIDLSQHNTAANKYNNNCFIIIIIIIPPM